MLKIFLSSTFVDLEDERAILITKISPLLDAVHMERFIPDGRRSQAVALDYLKKSDIVIFLISPYYGSLIGPNACLVEDCKADGCPKGDISYTHCEYRFTVAEKKPHMVYMVSPEAETTNSYVAKKCADNKALYDSFKQEIYNNEMASSIGAIDINQYGRITSDLADNIVRWYGEGKIEIAGFFGRGNELKKLMELVDNGNERVLVHGVGGVGKTTLIQVMLLLQALKGKRVYAIGTPQSYLSGSGYPHFLSSGVVHKVTQRPDKITLTDLANLFDIQETKRADKEELKKSLLECLKEGNVLTFIDDFHLADPEIVELVQQISKGIILASKEDSPYGRNRLRLEGVEQAKRIDTVRNIAQRLGVPDDLKAFQTIANISEGHPVVMEILINNYQNVDYRDVLQALVNEEPTEEDFLKRAVISILSPKAFETLQHLTVINPDLNTNLDFNSVRSTFPLQSINELTRKGLLVKRDNDSEHYRITYQSIQQIVSMGCQGSANCHQMALSYYMNKMEHQKTPNPSDSVELMFHIVQQLKSEISSHTIGHPNEEGVLNKTLRIDVLDGINIFKDALNAHDYSYGRLAIVCEELIPLVNQEEKRNILIALGQINHNLNLYYKAERSYQEALEIGGNVAEQSPNENIVEQAWIHSSLGKIYAETLRHERAKESFLRSLKLYVKLAEADPDTYLRYVAGIQCNLGLICTIGHQYDEAEKAFQTAMSIYGDIADGSSDQFDDDLAMIHTNLGTLYSKTKRHKEAEVEYLEALDLCKKLAEKDPNRNAIKLAGAYHNLGLLFTHLKRYEEAERTLLDSMSIYEKLAKQNYSIYAAELAGIKTSLGNLYKASLIIKNAEGAYKEAIVIFENLTQTTPGVYEDRLAGTYCSLGNLYMYSMRREEAVSYLKKAIEIFTELSKQNPNSYSNALAGAYTRLGDVYRNVYQLEEAEKEYRTAFDIRFKLAEKDPKAYYFALYRSGLNLGVVLTMRKKKKESDEVNRKLMKIRNMIPDDKNP